MNVQKNTLQITKSRDPYPDITALSDFCRQRGWKVIKEVVTISIPEGRELEDLRKYLKAGKIRVV